MSSSVNLQHQISGKNDLDFVRIWLRGTTTSVKVTHQKKDHDLVVDTD